MIQVYYVAMGVNARRAARASIESLRRFHPDWDVHIISDKWPRVKGTTWHEVRGSANMAAASRAHKLRTIPSLAPQGAKVVYLDADTIIRGSLQPLVDALDAFPLVFTPSVNQQSKAFAHVGAEETSETLAELGYTPVCLQAGAFAFKATHEAIRFIWYWHQEWLVYGGQDQAALMRALHRRPVPFWVLGSDYSNGSIVEHRFGEARE